MAKKPPKTKRTNSTKGKYLTSKELATFLEEAMAKKPQGPGNGNGKEDHQVGVPAPEEIKPIKLVSSNKEADDDTPTEEDIEKLSKAFTKMLTAEMRGDDSDMDEYLDPDDFAPRVADSVTKALHDHEADIGKVLSNKLDSGVDRFGSLFHPKTALADNKAYRSLVSEGYYSFVGESNLFEKFRGYHGALDVDRLEAEFRRADSAVRALDQVTREELLFNFVNLVMGTEFGSYTGLIVSDNFVGLPPDVQNLLRELALYYTATREHAQTHNNARDKATRDFDASALARLVAIPKKEGGSYPLRVEYAHVARTIRPENYYVILWLVRALASSLPSKTLKVVEEVLKEEKLDLNFTTINIRLMQPSKYLRNAFIALSRGHGSFEAFFTALHTFHDLLSKDLNKHVRVARQLVYLYDNLGLDISKVISASSKRLLSEAEVFRF